MCVLHVRACLESAQEFSAGINLSPVGPSTGHRKRRWVQWDSLTRHVCVYVIHSPGFNHHAMTTPPPKECIDWTIPGHRNTFHKLILQPPPRE